MHVTARFHRRDFGHMEPLLSTTSVFGDSSFRRC
jgi:hypothetical protein